MTGARHHRWDDLPREELNPSIGRRLITGDAMMIAHVYLTKGAIVPKHSHHNEQITYILEGVLRFHLGDDGAEIVDVAAGEVLTDSGARSARRGSTRGHARRRHLHAAASGLARRHRYVSPFLTAQSVFVERYQRRPAIRRKCQTHRRHHPPHRPADTDAPPEARSMKTQGFGEGSLEQASAQSAVCGMRTVWLTGGADDRDLAGGAGRRRSRSDSIARSHSTATVFGSSDRPSFRLGSQALAASIALRRPSWSSIRNEADDPRPTRGRHARNDLHGTRGRSRPDRGRARPGGGRRSARRPDSPRSNKAARRDDA